MKLKSRITLFVGLSTALASSAIASGVLFLNQDAAMREVESNLASLVAFVKDTPGDQLSNALLAVEPQEATLVFEDESGLQTILQEDAGPIDSQGVISESLDLGSGERLIFAMSTAFASNTFSDSVILSVLLVMFVFVLTLWLSGHLLANDLKAIDSLVYNAKKIANSESTEIQLTTPSSDLSELAVALQTMVNSLRESRQHLQEFLSDSSHELRTPLTIIRGHLDLMAQSKNLNNDKARNSIAKSQAAAIRMQKIINDLLLLAELSEAPILESNYVNVSKLVRDYIQDFRLRNPNRKVILNELGAIEVNCVEYLFERFLSNAFANIEKYTPSDSKVLVTISPVGAGFKLEIEDNGSGISGLGKGETIKHFLRFNSNQKSEDSSGLGLSIMAQIAKKLNGEMSLSKSQLGGLKVSASFLQIPI